MADTLFRTKDAISALHLVAKYKDREKMYGGVPFAMEGSGALLGHYCNFRSEYNASTGYYHVVGDLHSMTPNVKPSKKELGTAVSERDKAREVEAEANKRVRELDEKLMVMVRAAAGKECAANLLLETPSGKHKVLMYNKSEDFVEKVTILELS